VLAKANEGQQAQQLVAYAMTASGKTIYEMDPLRDPRWPGFVDSHPKASAFHTPEWLQALGKTYGYRPLVFTSAPPGMPLTNGIVFCQVDSWLTGRRLVSLPFSDHCEPLVGSAEELHEICGALRRDVEVENWKYIELRPRVARPEPETGFQKGREFYLHGLDLQASEEELFRSFHKDCVQRKVRRAEREALIYEEGRSERLLSKFYQLQLLTRRRHQLPPQPLGWFRNLCDCLGESLTIRVASKNGQPVASILTLRFKDCLVYKYGCSDSRFHNLGGMALLFWRAIQEAKRAGALYFDMGRSDCDNAGLLTFKEHWGCTRSPLSYWTYPAGPSQTVATGWQLQVAKQIFARVPDGLLTVAGKLLYRHIE